MERNDSKYKVAIVDDHALFAGSLEKLINSFPKFVTVFHVRHGVQLQQKLAAVNELPDVVLLDINMPVLNGFDTAQWLTKNYPKIKFLALTMDDEEESIIKMLRLGAKGYLLKDMEPETLQYALEQVIVKGYFHTEEVSQALWHSLENKEEEKEQVEFKPHELVFLQLASSEMTYKEIADQMNLSPKTIDGYRQELFQRLDIKNRVGLVMYGIKNNLIQL